MPDGTKAYTTNKHWLKREALAYATDQEQLHRRRPGMVRPSDVPMLSEYADEVIKSRNIAPSTRNSQRSLWKRVELEFGATQLHEIRTRQIRAWVASLSDDGLAPSTVKSCYGLVKLTLDNAVADDYIIQTPCVAVKLPQVVSTRSAANPDDLLEFVEALDERYQAAAWFMAATGARIGETLALNVSDIVEIPSPKVSISKAVTENTSGRPVVGTPKTGAGVRTVSLPVWCSRLLHDHVAGQGLSADDFLFPAPDGGLMDPRRFRKRYWNPARSVTGIDVTPHQLRHLQASILIQENRPDTELAARLGHSNSRVTHAVYAHWLKETDEGAAAVIPDFTERRTG